MLTISATMHHSNVLEWLTTLPPDGKHVPCTAVMTLPLVLGREPCDLHL